MSKKKIISSESFEKKNERLTFRVPSSVRIKLKKVYQSRTYPDPYDFNSDIPFKSEAEYLTFCVRCLNKMSPEMWFIFKHMFNPEISKFGEDEQNE